MAHIFTGDTVRVKATFRDYAPEGQTGALADPDGNVATIKIYDVDSNEIDSGSAIRESAGLYRYDWTAPDEGVYYIEFKGVFGGKPQLARMKLQVRFRPDAS